MRAGSDLGSSYVAKAAQFYWVMSFPVGAAGLPVQGFASPALAKSVLIFLFGSLAKASTLCAHTHVYSEA